MPECRAHPLLYVPCSRSPPLSWALGCPWPRLALETLTGRWCSYCDDQRVSASARTVSSNPAPTRTPVETPARVALNSQKMLHDAHLYWTVCDGEIKAVERRGAPRVRLGGRIAVHACISPPTSLGVASWLVSWACCCVRVKLAKRGAGLVGKSAYDYWAREAIGALSKMPYLRSKTGFSHVQWGRLSVRWRGCLRW